MTSWRCAVVAGMTLIAAQACAPPQQDAVSPEAAGTRRNIVFIVLDDLRYDAMGFLTPGLETPNIDQLARQGVHFENASVTTALCSPSRATILTGMTTANHRIVDNNNSSEEGLVFFPKYLQQAGYQTGFFGKWHMGSATDAPRNGFDKWVSFKGQGTYLPTDGLTAEQVSSGAVHMLNVDGAATPRKGYITDELTDYALDWLSKERDPEKPFFLYLSHKAVHSDAVPAKKFADQYADMEIVLPASMADTPANRAGKPMWVRNQRNSWHGVDFMYHSDEGVREYLREYYRTLSSVDESLGRIMAYLREQGLEDDTLVVFYSDNGFLFGDHGLIDKRNAYEPSIRVPLIMSAPGLLPAGVTREARVRNVDLAPTFLDVAGVAPPAHFNGRSFLDVATGEGGEDAWNDEDLVYEYYWEWTFPHTPTTFAIVHEGKKYIQYHGVWDTEELYDLRKDPAEMVNLIADPAMLEAKIDLRARLFAGLANAQGQHVVPYGARTAEGIVWRSLSGATAAPFPDRWLKQPDRPDRLNGAMPDSPAKLRADQAGKRYIGGY